MALAMQFKFGYSLYVKLCGKCENKVTHCCRVKINDISATESMSHKSHISSETVNVWQLRFYHVRVDCHVLHVLCWWCIEFFYSVFFLWCLFSDFLEYNYITIMYALSLRMLASFFFLSCAVVTVLICVFYLPILLRLFVQTKERTLGCLNWFCLMLESIYCTQQNCFSDRESISVDDTVRLLWSSWFQCIVSGELQKLNQDLELTTKLPIESDV